MCWHASDLEPNLPRPPHNGLEMRRNMLCEGVSKVFEIIIASVLQVQKNTKLMCWHALDLEPNLQGLPTMG